MDRLARVDLASPNPPNHSNRSIGCSDQARRGGMQSARKSQDVAFYFVHWRLGTTHERRDVPMWMFSPQILRRRGSVRSDANEEAPWLFDVGVVRIEIFMYRLLRTIHPPHLD